MNFREAIASIPFVSTSNEASGLLAPIIRAQGHILYLIATIAVSETNPERYHLTDEEAHRELLAATGHLSRTVTVTEQAPVSTLCKSRVIAFVEAVRLAAIEYAEWPHDERGTNLKDLADRAAALGAFFDLELAGLQQSDPGRTL